MGKNTRNIVDLVEFSITRITFQCYWTLMAFQFFRARVLECGQSNWQSMKFHQEKGTFKTCWLLKEKFTPEWPYIFFTPIKSLHKDMLFTKISASNVRYNPTKLFPKLDNWTPPSWGWYCMRDVKELSLKFGGEIFVVKIPCFWYSIIILIYSYKRFKTRNDDVHKLLEYLLLPPFFIYHFEFHGNYLELVKLYCWERIFQSLNNVHCNSAQIYVITFAQGSTKLSSGNDIHYVSLCSSFSGS